MKSTDAEDRRHRGRPRGALRAHVWGRGVALPAALQLFAVLPSLTPPSLNSLEPVLEFDRTEHPIRALLMSPIEHENGRVAVSTGAGLGIEIDRAALARFRATD